MLSLGIALITIDGKIVDTLNVNIKKREDAKENPNTMNWWKTQPLAWELCHQNMVSAQEAMSLVAIFYKKYSSAYKLVWIASPVCFDWMFLKSYYEAFAPPNSPDIGFKATCISTLRDCAIKCKIISNREYHKMIASIPSGTEHVALDDAKCQGRIFINLTKLIQQKSTLSKTE